MGGSLGGIFSNKPQGATTTGPNGASTTAPSFLQSLVQGTAKGAGTAFGKGMQGQPGGGGLMQAPSATPVDPRFFQPSAFAPPMNGAAPGGGGNSAFYG